MSPCRWSRYDSPCAVPKRGPPSKRGNIFIVGISFGISRKIRITQTVDTLSMASNFRVTPPPPKDRPDKNFEVHKAPRKRGFLFQDSHARGSAAVFRPDWSPFGVSRCATPGTWRLQRPITLTDAAVMNAPVKEQQCTLFNEERLFLIVMALILAGIILPNVRTLRAARA